tara:strand:+ start:343 stop:759 length:417 start_codon:yes stop_codon:yes gene_type:complete
MNSEVIDGFFQAMSSGDADAAEKFFSEKSEFTDTATGMTMRGVDENLMDVKNWMSTFSDMKVTALRHVESGNVVATEMQFEGTNTGEMAMPDGSKIPATGKTVKMQGCQVVEVEDGKMVKGTQYYNPMAMMEQLGLTQ